jgi:opacity family porin
MKKIFGAFIFLSLIATEKTNAQLQKGNVLVGGDLANFDVGLRKNAGFDISLSPRAAWFISNNIAVGPYIDFELSKANKASATVTDYGIGALGRYYLGANQVNTESVLRHTRAFVEGNVGVAGRNVSDGGGSTNGLGLGIGPGIAYFITPNVGLETILKYNGMLGFGDATTQSDLNLSVGFQIYLPGRSTQRKVMNDVK